MPTNQEQENPFAKYVGQDNTGNPFAIFAEEEPQPANTSTKATNAQNPFAKYVGQDNTGNPFAIFAEEEPQPEPVPQPEAKPEYTWGETVANTAMALGSKLNQGALEFSAALTRRAQAPTSSVLADALSAAAAVDRGITDGWNFFGGDAKYSKSLQRQAQMASDFAAEQRAKNVQGNFIASALDDLLEASNEKLQWYRDFDQTMNPQFAAQQQAVADAKGFWGTTKAYAQNPMALAGDVAGSAPAMLAGAGLARAVGATTLARGGTMAQATARASTAGLLAEGATSGLMGREQLYGKVSQMPYAQLMESPRFEELVKGGMSFKQARERLANELADQVTLPAAMATIAGGKLMNWLFRGDASAALLAGQKATLKTIPRNAAQEGAEEAVQSVGEEAASHRAEQQADVHADFDLGGTMARGLMTGAAMGAGGAAGSALDWRGRKGAGAAAAQAQGEGDEPDEGLDEVPGEGPQQAASAAQQAFSREGYVQYRRTLESGGNPQAKAKTSSAFGIDQFLDGTWLDVVAQAKPDWAEGLTREQLLAQRANPQRSGEMADFLDRQNAQRLQSQGLEVNNHNLYAMHHFGAKGLTFAKAAMDAPMAQILTEAQLKANPYLAKMSKAQLIAHWDKRAGVPTAAGHDTPSTRVQIDDAADARAAEIEVLQSMGENLTDAQRARLGQLQAEEAAAQPARSFEQELAEAAELDGQAQQAQQAGQAQSVPGRAAEMVLQNRDRSTAASIEQMNAIAAKPDYLRTGPSRTMDQGAPVVFGDFPASSILGREETVADGRGDRVKTRYAVVDAADVIPSNTADGLPVQSYAAGEPGKLRAVAGNGRAAGLIEAYNRGTASQYRQELMEDAQSLGIEPAHIERLQSPMLVRIMDEADVTPDIGDRSNTAATARLSPLEEASNDAKRVNLAALEFGEDGSPTAASLRGFINAMPEAERGNMLGPDGAPTRQAVDRLMAAAFKQAYGNDELVKLHAQATDPEARTVMAALADSAGAMAQLAGAGEFDIRQAVADAAALAVNARRKGRTLAQEVQNLDLDMNPEALVIAQFMAQNIRSARRIADGLRNFAQRALQQVQIAQQNAVQGGMFGDQPTLTRKQLFEEFGNAHQQPAAQPGAARAESGQAPAAQPGRAGPDAQLAQPERAHARAAGDRPADRAQGGAAGQGQVDHDAAPKQSRSGSAAGAQPNGVPAGLPAQSDADSQFLELRINRWLAANGNAKGRWRADRISAVSLPHALHHALARFTDATGTRVVLFRNRTPEIDDFNGVNFRDGRIFINETSEHPLTLTAAHEWVHDLARTHPELYQQLEDEVRRQGRIDAWHVRNVREEGMDRGRDHAIEELTASAVSDAMTDPAFLQRMAHKKGGLFQRVARSFLEFLDTLTQGWRDQGSNAYLRDVQAFRDKLEAVLDLYERQASRQAQAAGFVQGRRQAGTFDQARQAARDFQGKALLNAATGIQAAVSRNALDKMLSGKAVSKSASPAAHAHAVANLDQLFERAIHGWSKPDRAGDTNIVAVHRFFAPLLRDGKALLAKLTVKETAPVGQSNVLYTVEAVEFDEGLPALQWVDRALQEDGVGPGTKNPPQREWADEMAANSSPSQALTRPHDTSPGRSAEDVRSLAQKVQAFNRQAGQGVSEAMFQRVWHGKVYARDKEALDHARASAAAAPAMLALHRDSVSRANVLTRAQVVKQVSQNADRVGGPAFSRKSKDARQLDKDYFAALDAGDMQAAQRIVEQSAQDAGYSPDNSGWRMSHEAPNSRDGFSQSLASVRESGMVPDDYWTHPHYYVTGSQERMAHAALLRAMSSMDARARAGKDPAGTFLTVYRAVPKDVKDESIRNGDWIAVTREYAQEHGQAHIKGPFRVIAKSVRAGHIYWNGDSPAEWGYDDGREYAYRNTKNNRKLLDVVTRDDEGNIIPPSQRFNLRKEDVRFSRSQRVRAAANAALDKVGDWMDDSLDIPEHWSPAEKSAASKFDRYSKKQPLSERVREIGHNARDRVVQGVVDQFRPLKGLSKTAWMQAQLSKGTDGAVEAVATLGIPVLKDGAIAVETDQYPEGFLGELSKQLGSTEEVRNFFMYVVGNRADRLSKEWTVTYADGTTVRYKDQATALQAAKGKPGAKAQAASRENLFNAEEIEAMKNKLYGKMANGRPRPEAYHNALVALNRYNRSILDIAEAAGLIDPESRKQWESDFYVPFYRVSAENNTAFDFSSKGTGLARQQVIRRLEGGTDKLGDPLENLMANWHAMLTASMRNLAANNALNAAQSMGEARQVKEPVEGGTWTMQGGKKVYWQVDDPLVLIALESLNFNGYNNALMRTAGKAKHMLTVGVTASPVFRIRNLIRDTLQATATADVGYMPIWNIIKGFWLTRRGSNIRAQLIAGGGTVRFGSFNDGDQARNYERVIAMGIKEDQILNTPEKVRRFFGGAWNWYQRVGDRAEMVNRAVIYQRTLAKTNSHLKASFEARDLMNYTSMGSFVAARVIAQTVPFANARTQGLDRLVRGAARDPRRFWAVTGVLSMASALLLLYNIDDDEYKAMPDHIRNTYWPVKKDGKWYYIPKPFEVGALGTIVERGTELMISDGDYQAKDFKDSVMSILMNSLSMDLMPQIFKPVYEVASNHDRFRGQAIEGMALERLLPEDRYDANTSAAAIAAGRALGASPKKIEHLIRGYFGWLGVQALNAGDWMARPMMDLPESPKSDLSSVNNWFVVGDMVKDSGTIPSKYAERFYRLQSEINEIYASASNARRLGELQRYQELVSRPEMAAYPVLHQAQKGVTLINQQMRLTLASSAPAAEKNRRLQELRARRDEIARRVDKIVREAQMGRKGGVGVAIAQIRAAIWLASQVLIWRRRSWHGA